jgi:hypothetical protein
MKKLYLLLCIIVMAVGFSGCIAMATGTHHPRTKSTEKPHSQVSPPHTPAELREQALFETPQSPA